MQWRVLASLVRTSWLAALVILLCASGCVARPSVRGGGHPARPRNGPVMIWNGLVDPKTGAVLRKFEADWWQFAYPLEGKPGLFSNGLDAPFHRIVVDADAMQIVERPTTRTVQRSRERDIFRLNADGTRAWTFVVNAKDVTRSIGGRFMPMSDGEFDGLFIGEYLDGTRAIDIETGQLEWYEPRFSLDFVDGDVCVGGFRSRGANAEFALLETKTGRVLHETSVDMRHTWRVRKWGEQYLLKGMNNVFEVLPQPSFLVDQQGNMLHLCAEPLSSLVQRGGSYVYATNIDVRSLSPSWGGICDQRWKYEFPATTYCDGEVSWSEWQRHKYWYRPTALCSGEHNEVFAANLGRILQNGAMVACIDAATGAQKWFTRCPPVSTAWDDIGHPADSIYIELRGEELVVVAQGSSCFIEVLDVRSGKRLRRFDYLTHWE